MTKRKPMLMILIGCLLLVLPASAADTQHKIEKPVRQSIDTRRATQRSEQKWRLEREKLIVRFENLQKENARLKDQIAALEPQVQAARARVGAKEKQLADIEQISSQIRPFLEELIYDLKSQLAQGLPFLMDERQQRIQKLTEMMPDPEITISEKYRKVMEALLVEAEYGFTIEVYRESITIEGQDLLADIFRLGRLSLFYQILGRKSCGFYNVRTGAWQPLPAIHNPQIQTAIEIAAKRRPVELLSLPLGRMVTP